MSTRMKVAARATAIGAVAAAALLGTTATASAIETTPLSPIYTIGHGASSGPAICGGWIDATAYPGNSSVFGTNSVSLTTHFIGITDVCMVEGTLKWHNLDTGATGTKDWWLAGYDGPHAPTAVYFTPGAGKVSVEITATTPNIPSTGQFTAP